jgi:hypothetical protein
MNGLIVLHSAIPPFLSVFKSKSSHMHAVTHRFGTDRCQVLGLMQRCRAKHEEKRTMLKKLILATVAGTVLMSGQGIAQPTSIPFEAGIDGIFWIPESIGESPLFVVEELATGEESTLGEFTFTSHLLHNLANVPSICTYEYFSSSGVDGFGFFDFSDGQLRLERVSASSCYDSGTITLSERWRIASGTGAYVGATGKLTRTYEGTAGVGHGTFSGTIKF